MKGDYLNNILIIGNGFDTSHFNEIPYLKSINSFNSLKNKVEIENKEILNKINNTEGINNNWNNIERVKPQLEEEKVNLFLTIVKNWSDDIDEKAINHKKLLFKPSFKNIIEEDNFIVLSLNYTNLINNIYGVSKNNIVQLHVGNNGLPYMDFNDTYVPNNNNFKKVFGFDIEEIANSQKIAIGLEKEKEILKRQINKNETEVNVYIFGASLDGVDFKYFKCLIYYLNNNCKYMQDINIYIKRYGNNCEEFEWIKKMKTFFSNNPIRMNLRYNNIKMEENKDEEWLNIIISRKVVY